MTKEEAATEETRQETKTETAPEAPPKTDPEAKVEGEASGEGAGEEGKEGESKPEGKTSSTSTRKKKWLPWQRREGNSVKGQSTGAEAANSSEERQPTEAEVDAELQKRIQDLEQQKNMMQHRLQQYKKISDLEKECSDMKGEIDTLKICVARPEELETKVPDEGQ
uniref:p19 protein n=1 Tax=Paracentrotus lividus TaxID=7656 RepID=I2FL82_PARLI|nr:P19 protein [Paracentrotus lividus]